MTSSTQEPAAQDHGRAGRNLPAAITSAVVLVALIVVTLVVWKTAFMFVVAAAVVVAVWELHRGFGTKGIDVDEFYFETRRLTFRGARTPPARASKTARRTTRTPIHSPT